CLGDNDVALLQTIPLRGSLGGIPADPTIYRFYEIVQVYGTTLKALIHEKFGDGIISAINFKLNIDKVSDPDGEGGTERSPKLLDLAVEIVLERRRHFLRHDVVPMFIGNRLNNRSEMAFGRRASALPA